MIPQATVERNPSDLPIKRFELVTSYTDTWLLVKIVDTETQDVVAEVPISYELWYTLFPSLRPIPIHYGCTLSCSADRGPDSYRRSC